MIRLQLKVKPAKPVNAFFMSMVNRNRIRALRSEKKDGESKDTFKIIIDDICYNNFCHYISK